MGLPVYQKQKLISELLATETTSEPRKEHLTFKAPKNNEKTVIDAKVNKLSGKGLIPVSEETFHACKNLGLRLTSNELTFPELQEVSNLAQDALLNGKGFINVKKDKTSLISKKIHIFCKNDVVDV